MPSIFEITNLLLAAAAFIAAATGVWKLKAYHIQINSRMDQLLKVTRQEAHAVGRSEGIESERERKAS